MACAKASGEPQYCKPLCREKSIKSRLTMLSAQIAVRPFAMAANMQADAASTCWRSNLTDANESAATMDPSEEVIDWVWCHVTMKPGAGRDFEAKLDWLQDEILPRQLDQTICAAAAADKRPDVLEFLHLQQLPIPGTHSPVLLQLLRVTWPFCNGSEQRRRLALGKLQHMPPPPLRVMKPCWNG